MALTGMQIYKSLPKTNCKKCGYPTCMAFAMQVAAKQKALADCPEISADAQSALSDAAAPPMKLVKIGPSGKQFEFGQETVMFRHEEKFHHGTGIAVRVPASLSDAEAAAKIDKINSAVYMRVGQELKVSFCAVEVDKDPAGRAKMAAEKSKVPLILMGKNADALKTALEAVKDKNPLVYKADASNVEALAEAAAAAKVPLAISGQTLEELGDNVRKAKDKGVENIVLAFSSAKPGDTLRDMTIVRRAALKKGFRELGYPSMVEIDETESFEQETVLSSIFCAKYAGIVILNYADPCSLLPILTTVQNVYTDPQKPNVVETKLYEVGHPNEKSPVLFTTNFSLTYFSVEGEVERSKIPAYICVVDTEGLGVLNAYAGDKISAEKVVKTIVEQGVLDKVKHRKLIIPGYLPVFRAEIEDTSDWEEVIIGPELASKIPAFLNEIWK